MSSGWKPGISQSVVALALLALVGRPVVGARADAATPDPTRRPILSREAATHRGSLRPEGQAGGSWWLGTAGIALALAAVGWASVAARRSTLGAAGGGASSLRVLGRTSLSPRHSVYLLRAGDRVLIVGTGPQGAPSLLGEMTGPVAETAPAVDSSRFDVRVGDDA